MGLWEATDVIRFTCPSCGAVVDVRTTIHIVAFPGGVEPDPFKHVGEKVFATETTLGLRCQCRTSMKGDHVSSNGGVPLVKGRNVCCG